MLRKTYYFIVQLSLLFLLSHIFSFSSALAIDIPSSSRLTTVINKIKPILLTQLQEKGLHFGDPVFIRIFKQSKELEVWVEAGEKFKLFKIYPICYFSGNLGPKEKTGDNQSPEGFYSVKPDQMNPSSQYHLSFNLGYPNAYDKTLNRTGSLLMVHGNCVSLGCYAMTDGGIEEIYTLVDGALRNDQKSFMVHIFPFRMTKENMLAYWNSSWLNFWLNLKEGYDYFEQKKIPPDITVKNKQYVF